MDKRTLFLVVFWSFLACQVFSATVRLIPESYLNVGNQWDYQVHLTNLNGNDTNIWGTFTQKNQYSTSLTFDSLTYNNVTAVYNTLDLDGDVSTDISFDQFSVTHLRELQEENEESIEHLRNGDPLEVAPIWIDENATDLHVGHGQYFGYIISNPSWNWNGTSDTYFTFERYETITVPAGTFDCIVVYVEDQWDDGDGWWGYAIGTVWIDPYIGIIKEEQYEYMWDNEYSEDNTATLTKELTSTNVTGSPEGLWTGTLDSDNCSSGTMSNWQYFADGTTTGQWSMNCSGQIIESYNASGTWSVASGKLVSTYTGTANESSFGTSSFYTLQLFNGTISGNSAQGDYTINFNNSLWTDDSGTWAANQETLSSTPISNHVFNIEIELGTEYDSPDSTNPNYDFEIEVSTDEQVNLVEVLTPAGNTLTIPNDPGIWDEINQIWTERYYDDYHGCYEWEYSHNLSDLASFDYYDDGLYTITIYYVDGSYVSTTAWFGVPGTSNPIPMPTQKPFMTNVDNMQGDLVSPKTFCWEPFTDPHTHQIWLWFEKADSEEYDYPYADNATCSDPIPLSTGLWTAGLGIGPWYNISNNGDDISVEVGKYCDVEYKIAVGQPWFAYGVWGGNYLDTTSPNWWEYFHNIDQQLEYTMLGASLEGNTETFTGDYDYYVIASLEPVNVDTVQGSTGQYCGGVGTSGGADQLDNIQGAPDGQYGTIGHVDYGGTFRGFVVIDNPGDWQGLTVITDQGPKLMDLNANKRVDLNDWAILASYWMDGTCSGWDWCKGSDSNKDGIVSLYDLTVFAEDWMKGSSIVGHWKMDDNKADTIVIDSSDNGNNGAALRNTNQLYTTGQIDGALTFDGVDDYIDCGTDVADFKFGMGNFSICGWAKKSGDWSGSPVLFGVRKGVTESRYGLFLEAGGVRVFIKDDSGNVVNDGNGAVVFDDTNWHFVCMTIDRVNDTARLYADGAQLGSDIDISMVTGNIDPLGTAVIGINVVGLKSIFNGSIDDVRVYNKVLSPSEIDDLCPDDRILLSHWTMDDDAADTTVIDSSGSGNDGIAQQNTDQLYTTGQIDGALTFDGVDDYIDCGTDVDDFKFGTDNFSICGWAKKSGDWSGSPVLFGVRKGVTESRYGLFLEAGGVRAFIKDDFGNVVNDGNGAVVFGDTNWHFVCMTIDRVNGTARLYADGAQLGSDIDISMVTGNIDPLGTAVIGINVAGLKSIFNGSIDDVRVYNKVLSLSEIGSLYN